MELAQVLKGIVPGILAVLLFAGIGGGRLLGLGIAVGTWVAYWLLNEHTLPSLPPAEGTQGLVMAIGFGGVAACLPERVPRLWRVTAAAAVFASGSWLLLLRKLPDLGLLGLGLTTLGWLLVWWGFGTFAARRSGGLVAAVLCCCLVADAAVLQAAHSTLLAQMTQGAAVALGAAAVLGILRPIRLDLQACVPLVLAHAGWLLAGRMFGDEPNLVAMLCALVAPMGLLAGATGTQTETRRSIVLACVCALVPAAVAIALSVPAILRTLASTGD